MVEVGFSAYPLQSSLGVLGRKWAFLVLMNIALSQAQRFNELLRRNPGMSKRILAMRLRELEQKGFILRAEQRRAYTKWELSPKGADVLPVLLTLIHFGSKWGGDDRPPGAPSRTLSSPFEVAYRPKPTGWSVPRTDGQSSTKKNGRVRRGEISFALTRVRPDPRSPLKKRRSAPTTRAR
ncbi:MAG: helix-turn-helix transcriptional regulator [Thermoplasmata archaeon]|nr:helix-turn-helix transcriptional regulator [Thermoplasmata archaeon]